MGMATAVSHRNLFTKGVSIQGMNGTLHPDLRSCSLRPRYDAFQI